MSAARVELGGTLHPDGTLVLDEQPKLPPGRVRVVLEAAAGPAEGDPFWATLERIWADQKARGHVPRSVEEIEALRRELRDEMDREIEEAIRLQEESRRLRQAHEEGRGESRG
jgi:hypothetical protein